MAFQPDTLPAYGGPNGDVVEYGAPLGTLAVVNVWRDVLSIWKRLWVSPEALNDHQSYGIEVGGG